MFENHGFCPGEAKGRRIHVRLRNGYATRAAEPKGWPADTTRWTLEDHPFDVLEWEVTA